MYATGGLRKYSSTDCVSSRGKDANTAREMITWDLFIFVASACLFPFCCARITDIFNTLSCLFLLVVHYAHQTKHFIYQSHLTCITFSTALGHSTKRPAQCNYWSEESTGEEGLGHQRWTSGLLRGIGSDHLRPES